MVEWNPGLVGTVQRYSSTLAGTEPVAVQSSVLLTAEAPGDTLDIDVAAYSAAYITLDDDLTLTLSNVPDLGGVWSVRLLVQQGASAFSITWPSGTKWAGGTAPTLSSSENDIDIIDLCTFDAGVVWLGTTVGQAFAEPA